MYIHFFTNYLFSPRAGAVVRTLSWLSVVGIAIGVMAMVVVLSVMNGFGGSIRERLFSVEPHLVFNFKKEKPMSEIMEERNLIIAEVNQFKGVRAYLFEQQDSIVRTDQGIFGGAVLKGIKPAALNQFKKGLEKISKITGSDIEPVFPSVSSGNGEGAEEGATDSQVKNSNVLNESESSLEQRANDDLSGPELGKGEILIGADLARGLGIYEGNVVLLVSPESLLLPPGEMAPYERVVVKELIRTSMPEIDNHYIFYNIDEGLKRLSSSATLYKGIELHLPDPNNFKTLQNHLRKKGWSFESWQQRNSALFYSLKAEKFLMATFLGLTIFIASFSIIIVLVLLVVQKRKDIGVLMAMGLSPRKTTWLFTGIGMLLSGVGVISGVILGLVICLIGKSLNFIKLPPIYYDTRIPFDIDPIMVLTVLGIGLLVSFVAALIPAQISTKSAPSEALRG